MRGPCARITCICVCTGMSSIPSFPRFQMGSFSGNIVVSRGGAAVSHSRFYSRVNPVEDFLILQWRQVNVKPLDVLGQSSAVEQFLCSSSINIKYRCACVGEIIVEISDVESPLHLSLDVALLDVAVVYRFRFSRRDPRAFRFRSFYHLTLAHLPLTYAFHPIASCFHRLPHALFTARPSSSRSEHPMSEFVTRSTMDDFFSRTPARSILLVLRDRSDDFVLSYNAALPWEGFAAAAAASSYCTRPEYFGEDVTCKKIAKSSEAGLIVRCTFSKTMIKIQRLHERASMEAKLPGLSVILTRNR